MRHKGTGHRVGVLLALAAMAAGACSSPTASEAIQFLKADTIEARIGSGIVFLAMRVVPTAHMEALSEAQILLDAQGCLRRGSADRHTMVWPHGWTFDAAGDGIRILDEDGALVGHVGEAFSLGGGEVTSLPDHMGFTDADRELAEAHCPGRYWIVGEVVGD